jgi:hypothetical protein
MPHFSLAEEWPLVIVRSTFKSMRDFSVFLRKYEGSLKKYLNVIF